MPFCACARDSDLSDLATVDNTLDTFEKYSDEEYIVDSLGITKHQYRKTRRLIMEKLGPFNPEKTYCGPIGFGDALVPDLIFSFAGYVHDGIYFLIMNDIYSRSRWKSRADKWFRAIMYRSSDLKLGKFKWIGCRIADVYYYAVRLLGNIVLKKEDDKEE
ncbi:hypothetical protein ADUPG1_006928 [Aduncisulcus paluster]|uniref:Uncharacterized protein n=1 Tax=Aduncisulcus paluster TaxID=2918883 RepID=A0ABQ5KK43_9EUKA|nr:hypothetical protein ADUPG1_006928 [Aduncisulcus paluster]